MKTNNLCLPTDYRIIFPTTSIKTFTYVYTCRDTI